MKKFIKDFIEEKEEIAKVKNDAQGAKKELNGKKQEVFNKWKEVWETVALSSDKAETEKEMNEHFMELFENTYEFAKKSGGYNCKMNFCMKKHFTVILSIIALVYLVGFIWSVIQAYDAGMLIAYNVVMTVIAVLGVGVVGKWIDIKKYQETWARHSEHQFLLEQEMLLFLHQLEPYNDGAKEKVFVKRTIEIWERNQRKFNTNMEQKEKQLMDLFKYVKTQGNDE